ncbi:MAG TPA: Ni/Fe hydrogenase subunit alpha [Gammaproteobacteria bacterium]|nr:Ni/Fe hydrogenase subunit alpha [Gammaproteobacteria bacterium]
MRGVAGSDRPDGKGRTLHMDVPVLARVEGEGGLEVEIRDGRIETLRLHIFEPPRLFEKFLEGRAMSEVPDIVARICGICPVAYQMSAVHALEGICGCDPGPWVREMRRLLYCGEWMESHSLHIHLLAAPDFLGYPDAVTMARDHAGAVRRGLRLQALGNDIIRFWGGRSVHPVGVRVGGFHHAPAEAEAATLLGRLREAEADARALVHWTAGLDFPALEDEFASVALRHPAEYPMNEGRLVSDRGLDIDVEDFEAHFREHQVPHSTALHCLLAGEPYLVGPLARLNLNHDRLPPVVAETLSACGIDFPSRNMFHSIVARAVEIHYAVTEAIRILEGYRRPTRPWRDVTARAGNRAACTEAPRGILWHRYRLDEGGRVLGARIVPPTSQNQARIEADLRNSLVRYGLDHPDDTLCHLGERIIRNYDPCISCATHRIRVRLRRR